ncbi:hypothetical protein [Pseudomonas phage Almagne]|nr:hypothetical protein [Pseudomonas phage Almagne]
MKIIVTKLGTKEGEMGKGRVDFYEEEAVIHTEEFEGLVNETEYVRLVDLPIVWRASFISINGPFEGRIEE